MTDFNYIPKKAVLGPGLIDWKEIMNTPHEEIIEHLKAIRYKVDDVYRYKIDCEKDKERKLKDDILYQIKIVMTDQWYEWAKEFLALKRKYYGKTTVGLTQYLMFHKHGIGIIDTDTVVVSSEPLSSLKEFCLYKYKEE